MSDYAKVEIRIDTLGRDGIPHTFIVVTHPNGSTTEYGFVPTDHSNPMSNLYGSGGVIITGVPGMGPHEFNGSSGTHALSPQQYNSLMNFVNTTNAGQPTYWVGGDQLSPNTYNCSTWQQEAFKQAGIDFPGTVDEQWNPYFQRLQKEQDEYAKYAKDWLEDTASDTANWWEKTYDEMSEFVRDLLEREYLTQERQLLEDIYEDTKNWWAKRIGELQDSVSDLFDRARKTGVHMLTL